MCDNLSTKKTWVTFMQRLSNSRFSHLKQEFDAKTLQITLLTTLV